MIGITLDRNVVEAGEVLTGQIFWTPEAGRPARRIIAAAEWLTGGKGDVATGVGRSTQFDVRQGREAVFPFRFLIPYAGPVSFEGELITMIWKLRVRVEQHGFDEFAEAEFRVEPRGSQNVLSEELIETTGPAKAGR